MSWRVDLDDRARKDLRALGGAERAAVLRYLRDRIEGNEDPKRFGKALLGPLAGLWRYRVGDVRVIARIDGGVFVVLVVKIENRRTVYG